MTRLMNPNAKGTKSQQISPRSFAAFVAALALGILFAVFHKTNNAIAKDKESMSSVGGISASQSLTKSEVAGVPYYHCQGTGFRYEEDTPEVSLVLLHGAAFTKEDWKSSGILNDLCSREIYGKLNVFAMDLPTKSDFQDLQRLLDAMEAQKLVSKPVALITPSASGRTMVSWTASPTARESIPKYVRKWIPVAANSVSAAPDESVKVISVVPTLAIYGDKDGPGKLSSERLRDIANARVVQLVGSHPCYLDSPKEFVDEVLKFLES